MWIPAERVIARKFLLLLADLLDYELTSIHDTGEGPQRWFLMQGTALGAYRDQNFTPTEGDIDIGVYDRVMPSLISTIAAAGIEVNTFNRVLPDGKCMTVVCQWRGIHADIVAWQLSGSERFAQAPSDVQPHYCLVHPRRLIETHQPVTLFGRTFCVPSPIEEYLEREYGPDWRTPREDHVSRSRQYGYLEAK